MSDTPRRGKPVNPLVAQREQLVYEAVVRPITSKQVAENLGIHVAAVRLSLKRLQEKGRITLQKTDGVFLWSQHTD